MVRDARQASFLRGTRARFQGHTFEDALRLPKLRHLGYQSGVKTLARLGLVVFPALFLACAAPPSTPGPATSTSSAPAAPKAPPSASASASPDKEEPLQDAAVAKAADAYLALLESDFPETATVLGLHRGDGRLDARDKDGFAKNTGKLEAFLADLEKSLPKTTKLSPSARTDLALLRGMVKTEVLRRKRRPLETQPDLYTSPMGAVFTMTARDYAPAAVRAANVVARLEAVPGIVAEAKKNLESPPKVWTQVGIERAKSAKGFFGAQRAFLEKSLPGEGARVKKALDGAVAAYDDYAKFLEKTVLPRSKGDYAAGKPYFEELLREGYFVQQSADELEAMGKAALARTEAEMTTVALRIDPKAKGWPEVVAKVKKNHPKSDGLLAAYRDEVKRARDFLAKKDAVPFPEGDDLAVVDTPEFMRSTVTAAYDQPPAFDGATKGFFFVTPVDPKLSPAKQEEMLRENDHGDIVDTAVHEAYPGHHLQLSFAAKNPSKVRKAYDAAIFSEGWALYSEELMNELGYYTDEERLMQLEWTLVRAARIVIDVGLHTKGMTFDEAVKMLTDRVHLEHELAVSEVKRYTMSPTQPLAYLTGREAIFAIRAKYKERRKEAYSLKQFHTELLTRGTLPPGLLERELFGE